MKHLPRHLRASAWKWEQKLARLTLLPVFAARVILETEMVLGRRKKGETRECAQESTDGVGKHFFLGVLNEDGASKKTKSSGREDSSRLESVLEVEKPCSRIIT
jgi:hypothetical protein